MKFFGDKPLIGRRKTKSLKDHLVSAKIKCEPSSDNKSAPCCMSFIEKLTLFKTRIKVKDLALEKGF